MATPGSSQNGRGLPTGAGQYKERKSDIDEAKFEEYRSLYRAKLTLLEQPKPRKLTFKSCDQETYANFLAELRRADAEYAAMIAAKIAAGAAPAFTAQAASAAPASPANAPAASAAPASATDFWSALPLHMQAQLSSSPGFPHTVRDGHLRLDRSLSFSPPASPAPAAPHHPLCRSDLSAD